MTRLFGVVGDPVKHSLSPCMHNAAFVNRQIDASYRLFDVSSAELAHFLQSAERLGVVGLNITAPHKQHCLEYVSAATEEVTRCGAANTLRLVEGKWVAFNTDIGGVRKWIGDHQEQQIVILGSGGAAIAAAIALDEHASKVSMIARDVDKCRHTHQDALAGSIIDIAPYTALDEKIRNADILVQATSAPMGDEADAFAESIPWDIAKDSLRVFEMVYAPLESSVMQAAQSHGLTAQNGLGMLVHQAAESFEIFCGEKDVEVVMQNAISKTLNLNL